MIKDEKIESDVLIIGGGLAGCFAAIKAREQGASVNLVDKGYVSKTGQSPFAGNFAVFNSNWGHDLDSWIEQTNRIGEYINNKKWARLVFKEIKSRYQDLVSWGVEFLQDNGEPKRYSHPLGEVSEVVLWEPDFLQVLREQVESSGVNIFDRIMITDLIKHDGRIVGAVGFPMDNEEVRIFRSKATVLSAGASGFKSMGWPTHEVTGDAEAMAYRAGAEITGKEFMDTHSIQGENPGYRTFPKPTSAKRRAQEELPSLKGGWQIENSEGEEVPLQGNIWPLHYELEFEAHAGRAPLFSKGFLSEEGEKIPIVGGASTGMSVHSTSGICPVSTKCDTDLKGLYAAGDSLGTMWVGASYSGFGFATAFASVTGARAGMNAAKYSIKVDKPTLDKDILRNLKDEVIAPLNREGGFSPRWVTLILQNLMKPYFILSIKHEKRMRSALELLEFVRDHLVPKLWAKDAHHLRLSHETKNMVLIAEMILRASLFRKESRGCHYREDYPKRRDPDWLAWVRLKRGRKGMEVWKEPIPEEWWPDLSEDYEDRYPLRFPGE